MNVDPVQFGLYLKKLRNQKGLTLVELKELSGVSQPYLSQIENGKAGGLPSPDILRKLAGPLGVLYSDLMLKAGYHREATQEDIDSFFGAPSEKNSPIAEITFKELMHEQIVDDVNGIAVTVAIPREELVRRFFDIKYLLEHRERAFYNGRELSELDRKRALDVLKVLFHDYEKEE